MTMALSICQRPVLFIREIDDSRQYRLPSTRFIQVSSYRYIPVDNRMYVRSPAHQRVELESSFPDQAKNSFFSSSHWPVCPERLSRISSFFSYIVDDDNHV